MGRWRPSRSSSRTRSRPALGVLALFAVAVAIWAGSDWRAVFVAAALLAVPAMAIAYGSVCFPAAPELPHDHEPGLPRPYWFYWFALLLFVAIEFCVVFWSTDYLETERGLSDSGAAAASSAFLIGMTVGRALGGPLTRRFGSERLIAVALAVAAAGFAVFWLVPSSTAGGRRARRHGLGRVAALPAHARARRSPRPEGEPTRRQRAQHSLRGSRSPSRRSRSAGSPTPATCRSRTRSFRRCSGSARSRSPPRDRRG